MNLPLKMKRITSADLILNGMPVPVASIEFDSTEMSEKEVLKEISERFLKLCAFKYHEQWVKK